jgi:hypothetical protein
MMSFRSLKQVPNLLVLQSILFQAGNQYAGRGVASTQAGLQADSLNHSGVSHSAMFQTLSVDARRINNRCVKDNGICVYTSASGYEETFRLVKGKVQGKATKTYRNGDKEEFLYKNGVQHGKATKTYANGDVNTFNYDDGQRQGKSVYTWENRDVETGEYVDGELQGF